MKNKEKLLLIGSILMAVGLFMFFKNIWIGYVGFFRIGRFSTGSILIGLLLLDVILAVATNAKICKILIPVLAGFLVLSVILGTQLYFVGSALDMLLMLIPAAIGGGLLIRVVFLKMAEKKEEKKTK